MIKPARRVTSEPQIQTVTTMPKSLHTHSLLLTFGLAVFLQTGDGTMDGTHSSIYLIGVAENWPLCFNLEVLHIFIHEHLLTLSV